MHILQLDHITKDFGQGEVLRGIDLAVDAGEFLTLLGPSGCGKTTTLRIIAGLEAPTAGRVLLSGADVTLRPPEKRNVNTVFQNYALFPHMSVAGNIGYGLSIRGVKKPEIKRRVEEMLKLVQLEGFGGRAPGSLSGGQRQRVAIARAVVLSPDILLLDEPLGALDLQLRRQMQTELKALQQQLGITFIYITHDQEEALNMSNRIAVMREGLIEQMGSSEDIYEHPKTRFTAGFIGQTNLLEAKALGPDSIDIGCQIALANFSDDFLPKPGDTCAVCLRMERVKIGSEAPEGHFSLSGVLLEHRFAGGSLRMTVKLPDGQQITALSQTKRDLSPGDAVRVWWSEQLAAIVP